MTSNLIATINKYLKSAQKWSWNRGVTIPWSDVITDHTPLSLSTHLFVVIHVVIQLSIRHFSHDQALMQWKHQSTVQVQRRRERHRQEAIDTIYEYRDQDRPFETHNSLTPWSWSVLSYSIVLMVWFHYYRELESFLRTVMDDNRILYIHGAVFVHFNTTLHDQLQSAVYRMFDFNSPYALWHFIRTIRFILLFVASTSFGDCERIERLRVSSDPSTTLYPSGLLCESWKETFFKKTKM